MAESSILDSKRLLNVGHSRVTRVHFPPFYYDHENINNNAKVIIDCNDTDKNDVPVTSSEDKIALSLSQPPIETG